VTRDRRGNPVAGVWLALAIVRTAAVVALAALSPLLLAYWLLGDLPRRRQNASAPR
jgi:hypothetical protein